MSHWFTVEEVGNDRNVGRTKIYEEINTGRLKVIKIGRSTRITAEAIAEWQKLLEDESAAAVEEWRRRIQKQTKRKSKRRSDKDDDDEDDADDGDDERARPR